MSAAEEWPRRYSVDECDADDHVMAALLIDPSGEIRGKGKRLHRRLSCRAGYFERPPHGSPGRVLMHFLLGSVQDAGERGAGR